MAIVAKTDSVRCRLALLFALGITLLACAASVADDQKGITVEPVAEVAQDGSAALFVGIDQFTDDLSLRTLQYAVNDAIAQAHLFVIELKLIPAGNCYVALSGPPAGADCAKQLEELKAIGVHIVAGNKTSILRTLITIAGTGKRPADLAVFSISSHGFEEENVPYVIPSDGLRGSLAETALSLNSVESKISQSKAGKRLVFLDACRDNPTNDSKDTGPSMSAAFKTAWNSSQGQAVLASCDNGQVSYENPEMGHGVFTYYLLQACHGQALANSDGLITLGLVEKYVATNVHDWAMRNKPGMDSKLVQEPWFQGTELVDDVPLAIDPGIKAKLAAFSADVQKTIDELKPRIDFGGPFTPDLCGKLVTILKDLDSADPGDQKILSHIKDFAEGRIEFDFFSPYLQSLLNAPRDKVLTNLIHRANDGDAKAMNDLGEHYGQDKDYEKAMGWYRKGAEAGNGDAMDNIGYMYSSGEGVDKDYTQAMNWYLKGADAGSGGAMNDIGLLYENGGGVAQDYAQAMTWFHKGVDAGSGEAMNNIGWLYENGWGVAQDYAQAMTWFHKGVDAGSGEAMNNIGWLHQNGLGVSQDYAQAMIWFHKGADADNTDAMQNIGLLYENGWGVPQDYAQAMSWFHKGADAGSGGTMNNIGWLYQNGWGVPQDYAQAMTWFRKGADAGSGEAMNNIGSFYQNGWSVPQDYAQAMTWYHKGADSGSSDAMYNIGCLYQNGWGVPQDYAQAMIWYHKGADAGSVEAMNNIGSMYANAWGVDKNDVLALQWFEKAGDNSSATQWIASFYESGRGGLPQDLQQARQWYQKSADAGNDGAKQWLTQHPAP